MNSPNEHDDDLEPEVEEGEEIETEKYDQDDADSDAMNSSGQPDTAPSPDGVEKQQSEDEANDTI